MKENAGKIFAMVLANEGGYVDDPADAGGATKYGITAKTLGHVRGKDVSAADVSALTEVEAKAIFQAQYWMPIHGDTLPSGVDYAVFDAAIHSGPRQAALWLQEAIPVEADGILGPVTLAALLTCAPNVLVGTFCDLRLKALQRLPSFSTFGRGFTSRVERVRRDALALTQTPAPPSRNLQKETQMDQTQSIFQSRTVWSNIIGFGAFLLSITGHGVAFDTGQVTDSVMQLVTAGSFVASTIFRVLSTKKVAL
jgi:lysozyme family protein